MPDALGLDIGSETMSAAVFKDELIDLEYQDQAIFPSYLAVADGQLQLGHNTHRVDLENPLKVLHNNAIQVGQRTFTAPSIVNTLIAPWKYESLHTLGHDPDVVVAVVPAWRDQNQRNAYRRALQQHFGDVVIATEPEALSYAVVDYADETVAVWDFGYSHASVTVLGPLEGTNRPIIDHAFTPDASSESINAAICSYYGWSATPEALDAAEILRAVVAEAPRGASEVVSQGPDGEQLSFLTRDVLDAVAAHVGIVVEAFNERAHIARATRRLACGGYASDKGVQSALREQGALRVLDLPMRVMSSGAAVMGSYL